MKRRLLTGLVVGTAGVLAWQGWSLWSEGDATPVAMAVVPQTSTEVTTTPNAVETVAASPAIVLPDTLASAHQTTAAPLTNGVRVDMRGNTLSVSQQDARLSTLLQDISQQSNIVFHNVAALDDEIISAELDAVPLETGLRTLLAGYDSFFYYASTAPTTELQSVWVYPLGQGKTLAPFPTSESTAARNDVENSGDAVIDVEHLLGLAQNDADETQRLRALQRLTDTGVVPPRDWLENVLQNDRSETMRLEAFRTLIQSMELSNHDMRALANLAVSDASETLRSEAQQLLTDMNTAALAEPPEQIRSDTP